MTLEQALTKTVRTVQRALNDLELNLNHLAMYEEQFIEDEDFKKGVELEDATVDLVDMLTTLLGDLPKIAGEIRGECPPSQKAWWKLHKAKRKAAKTAERQAAKEAAAAEKAAEKTAAAAAEQALAIPIP